MTKEQESAAYYAVVPAPVRYDPDLSPSAKLLFCEITSLCRAKGYCWATNSYFTQLFNLSASTISRLISQLERRGHIAIQTAATETGSERHIYTDIYQVERLSEGIPEGGTQKQQAPPGGAQKAQGGVRKNGKGGVSKNRKQNDLTVNDLTEDPPCSPPAGHAPPDSVPADKPAPKPRREKSSPAHDPEAFEAFWAAYPRKDDRRKAIRAWDKLKPDKPLCRVMYTAMLRQKTSPQWTRDGGQYIPMFPTWLNGRRWEDQGVDPSQLPRPQDGGGYWANDPEVDT